MSSAEFVDLLTQVGVMLLAGIGLGFVMRKLKQPSVVGEMAAGILLGVTVLGSAAPGVYEWIFDSGDLVASTRGDIIKVGMLFFLFVAGSEVDLSDIKSLGRSSAIIGLIGTVLPILMGIGVVYATMGLWGDPPHRLAFSAFIGMNLANSANPVLARILIDLGLMKSRIATMMMTATVVDDLVNWTLYAVILGSLTTGGGGASDRGLGVDLLLVALLFVVVLVGLRWAAPKMVAIARRHLAWPNGYIAVVGVSIIVVSAASEAIGVQAFLGAFLCGVAFSGVAGGEGATGQKSLTHVAIGFFAPLFFVSMALKTDFVDNFDLRLVVLVIVVALVSKLVSVLIGVKAAGLPIGREAWAIAWGLNARGATGIILAATGREAGIITDEVFVALVVMAIVTSMLSGPMMVRSLGPLRSGMAEGSDDESELPDPGPAPAMAYAARMADRELTEAERAEVGSGALYRVVVAIDDPTKAAPLVVVAAELAASQQPAEVVLASFDKQTEVDASVTFNVLDAIASELDSLRGLEEIVQARGLTAVSVSQRSSDLAADIVAQAVHLGAHALVVGDRRDDPEWVDTVDDLIAGIPVDIFVVVAPRPRSDGAVRSGPVVLEAGIGISAEASLEGAVRLSLAGTTGPVVVGVDGADAEYRHAIERLGELGRPGRIEPMPLDSPEGDAVAAEARLVIRPFSAPDGLEPIERARPDAERFGCPVVLVAADPGTTVRTSLTRLLDEVDGAVASTID